MSVGEGLESLDNTLDAFGFVSGLPTWLVQVLATIAIVILFMAIKRANKRLEWIIKTVEHMGRATVDEQGNPLIKTDDLQSIRNKVDSLRSEFFEHANAAKTHYLDLEHVSSTDHWKTCDISKCIHLQQLFHRFDKLTERFDSFDKRAEETRNNTTMSLSDIRDDQKNLGRELADLARRIINVLSDNLKARGGK